MAPGAGSHGARAGRPAQGEQDEEQKAKITIRVTSTKMEAAMISTIEAHGGIQKFGAPPKTALEREAEALLEKFN